MLRMPPFRRHVIANAFVMPPTTGNRNALPILPRTAFHENGFAEAPLANMPVTPPASAVLISAPMLPGSCTSMATSTNASGRPHISLADVGRRLAMATRPERARDQGLLAVGRESRGGDRGDLERVPGFLRVADQMNAVEQQTRASRVGALGERAETRDDGILSARDGAHAGSVHCDTSGGATFARRTFVPSHLRPIAPSHL